MSPFGERPMYQVSGGCHCGNVCLHIELTQVPATYHPRACDCDFCSKHGAAYFSDPGGALTIRVRDASDTGYYRQGSSLAECLFCKHCGVLVGVVYRDDGRIYGAANVRAIQERTSFGDEQPVSPKALSDIEKITRWQNIWFSDVAIEMAESHV